MSVLKTSLLTCLKQMIEEKISSQVPGYRVSLSDFKTLYRLSYSWGLDPPGVSGNQLQVAGGKLLSIPDSLKHGPHWPPHTGNTCCISCPDLFMRQDFSTMDLLQMEGRGGRDTRAEGAESPGA